MEPETYVTLCFRSLIYIMPVKTRVFRTVTGIQRQKKKNNHTFFFLFFFYTQLTQNNSNWRGFLSSEAYHERRNSSALTLAASVWQKTKTKFSSENKQLKQIQLIKTGGKHQLWNECSNTVHQLRSFTQTQMHINVWIHMEMNRQS